MSAKEVKNARMSEEELDTLLMMDMEKIIELFADDTGGNQPPQFQSPPLPRPIWTRDENEQFEIVIAQCFMEAIENRWEAVAARLPGKTPAQLQERFQKLLNDISLIQNGYLVNIHDSSIINGTIPPPIYWTHHHHHRTEVVEAAANKAAPMEIILSSSAMDAKSNIISHKPLSMATRKNNKRKIVHCWTEQEHWYIIILLFFPLSYLFIYLLSC
nr:uncharacterized protein LOC112771914 [Arachis hypogaea]